MDLTNQSMAQFQRRGKLQRAQPLSRSIPWRSGTVWSTKQTPLILDSWESCHTVAMEWPMNCETTVPNNEVVKILPKIVPLIKTKSDLLLNTSILWDLWACVAH